MGDEMDDEDKDGEKDGEDAARRKLVEDDVRDPIGIQGSWEVDAEPTPEAGIRAVGRTRDVRKVGEILNFDCINHMDSMIRIG